MPKLLLTALPEEILSNFGKNDKVVSETSRQNGLQYVLCEAYIQDVELTHCKNRLSRSIEATVYRSKCKSEMPHHDN